MTYAQRILEFKKKSDQAVIDYYAGRVTSDEHKKNILGLHSELECLINEAAGETYIQKTTAYGHALNSLSYSERSFAELMKIGKQQSNGDYHVI